MASDPRIEAVADALRRLDGEPEAPLVSYGDDARFVLAAADAVDPARDPIAVAQALADFYGGAKPGMGLHRGRYAQSARALVDAIKEASRGDV